jgi:hypothetical protein
MLAVASSNIKILGFFISALANINLCFYPPDKFVPFYFTAPYNPPFLETNS